MPDLRLATGRLAARPALQVGDAGNYTRTDVGAGSETATRFDARRGWTPVAARTRRRLSPSLVWKAGLEPAAPCSQGRCATKLRHFQVVGCEARAGFASRASLAHSQPQETVAASVHACLATLVGPAGIEPALFRLGGGCSSVELRTQVRAGMATSCDRTGFTSLADARAVRRTQASSRCSGPQWPYPATGQDSHCSPSRARVNGLKRVLPAPCLPLPRAVGRRVPASLAGIALTLPDFIL
jgi:hypothetical protein